MVGICNCSGFDLPQYATKGAAGIDLRYSSTRTFGTKETSLTLKPLERHLVKTGIFLAIPETLEGQIRPRSGLALKKGLTILNTPGTIDSDYRGEIGVILVNLSNEEVEIEDGERIAQIIFSKFEKVQWNEVLLVEQLGETQRGEGGFGHTGTK